jgi:hypothetical protein
MRLLVATPKCLPSRQHKEGRGRRKPPLGRQMALIEVNSFQLRSYENDGSYSVNIGVGGQTPSKLYTVENVDDCRKALHAFAAEVAATGKPYLLTIRHLRRGGRKPSGYDREVANLKVFVNKEACDDKA